MEIYGLTPAMPADRQRLIRRLYLDLTGTSPSWDEVERFVNDRHPAAERKLIDRLLASPEYGERIARSWLDLARYSDTNGYEKDRPRSIWPYRDWVIDALNEDLPYNQFSIEQLAGDMLPGASQSHRIATGFHRNTMLNEEGGIDPLEYRYYALVDRVATTGTVWMGMTIGCAQCHTHKYDPITQHDYFALMALLNQANEPDLIVDDADRNQRSSAIEQQIEAAVENLASQLLPTFDAFRQGTVGESGTAISFQAWVQRQLGQARTWMTVRPTQLASTMPKLVVMDDDSVLASGDVTKRDEYTLTIPVTETHIGSTALRLEVLPHPSLPASGPGMAFYEGRRGDFFLSELTVRFDGQAVPLRDASHSFGKISVGSGSADAANVIDGEGSTGWSTAGAEGQPNQLVVNFDQPISSAGELQVSLLFERHFAAALGRFRLSLAMGRSLARGSSNATEPSPVVASTLPVAWQSWLSGLKPEQLTEDQYLLLQRHFVLNDDSLADKRSEIERLKASIPEQTRTLAMQQREPGDERPSHRHHRGEYLQPRELVEPGVPAVFLGTENVRVTDRLQLAQWLVSPSNPLVGRAAVNRAWREFFAVGIVDTAGDFGTQSRSPSHRELLDYLSLDLAQHDWSIKRLHRSLVGTSAYRQSVDAPPSSDPDNVWLSVFPQRRLQAEQIRDSLLSASGLLSFRMGGPSVYPPQPASVMELAWGSPPWETSQGADRYRRSVYTFSKRTAPFAAYVTFDGPTGEVCLDRRDRSTTPLQALTLLNDELYLELARALADQVRRDLVGQSGDTPNERDMIAQMFRRLLSRDPDPQELDAVMRFYQGLAPEEDRWTLVARALINTDEAISVP
jgi:hypothetical protein